MKKIRLFLPVLFITLALTGCAGNVRPNEYIETYSHDELDQTDIVIENDYLLLKFFPSTAQISLTDKRSGKEWHSNPPGAMDDEIAIGSMMERLNSQVIINYGQITGVSTELNNFSLSILNSNYDWEVLEDGVKVRFTIGRVEREYIIPSALPESRFKEYTALMDAEQTRALNNYYRRIDINNLRATDDRAELLEKYPELLDERVFELREGLQINILNRLEGYFEQAGYTEEDFLADKAAAGDSAEDTPVFNISVLYQLDGPEFIASVPLDEIAYRPDYPMLNFSVLPFFGAGGPLDEGFMLVPDGSGAIINFNNGKHNQTIYNNSVYGHDYALKRAAIITDNSAYFPVFGVSRNQSSFICVMEEGSESAFVIADVNGRISTYNHVSPYFTIINWDDVDISKANVYARAFERGELNGFVRQRYIFLDESDYVSMAEAYRDYLTLRFPQLSRTNENGLPLMLGIVGAIDRRQNILGVSVTRAYPLTTYEGAADIIGDFADSGINNIRVNLSGWFNGGVAYDAPTNIKLINSMGGKKGFANLLETASYHNASLFFDTDFTYIYNLRMFNSFIVNRDAAKRLSREEVRLYPYSSVWFGERTGSYGRRYSYYLAAPEFTMRTIDRFYPQLTGLGGSNIAFNDIGRSLNSNFDVKRPASRQDVAALHTEKMAELNESGANLMVRGGNVYTVPYVDFITDMELESKNFHIIDESIPFYQIVLHGLVPYSGTPLNLSPDYYHAILKAVETGAGLSFLFMNASGEEIQDTNYTRFFASDLARWGDRPFEVYHRINDQLSHTVNLFITGHEKLDHKVYRTEYEDGTQVIVNYGSEAFLYGDYTVAAMDFTVIK